MRKFHANGYDVADDLIAGLSRVGYLLEPGDSILDYGCGQGRLVYRFRELGFDARGFDLHNTVEYRDPADRVYFGFIKNPVADTADTTFAAEAFRIPFEDSSFDLVLSTSVLEHVVDIDPVMSEIARVLKPSGYALHLYPSRSVFIEPHIFVPGGSRFQSWWYFYFWALLGLRNEFQREMTAREVADRNHRYAKTGLHYWRDDEMRSCAGRYFNEVSFVSKAYWSHYPRRDQLRAAWRALKGPSPLTALGTVPPHECLLTGRKIVR